jgi:cell wall-associated NlpC family hydrolase/LysM repeat protein
LNIKNLTLGLALLYSGSAVARNEVYTVRNGDTISGIASRFHVKQKSIISYNGLSDRHRLKLGMKLTIPNATVQETSVATNGHANAGYAVRMGDHDISIANRLGISVHDLHASNPGVRWRSLQIGQRLTVKAKSNVSAAKVVDTAPTAAQSGRVVVQDGDNDWIIARRLGIKPRELRLLNPGTKWTDLRPGQLLNGGSKAIVAHRQTTGAPVLKSRYAAINADSVIIRGGPSTSSRKVTIVPVNTRVTVLDHESGWYRLRFPRGTEGWVRADLLRPVSRPAAVATAAKHYEVAAGRKSARRAKWASMKPVRARVRHSDSMVAMNLPGVGSDKLLKTAEGFRGVRYRYGAMSRSGTDCSGFTSQVFKSVGVRLPRVSRDQARVGAPVSGGKMKPGDLVFFRTMRGNRITHVGIYVGKNEFIHASSGGGRVQISSLNDRYYHNRFVTARRVVKGAKGGSATHVTQVAKREATKPRPTAAAAPSNEGVDENGVIQ